jgi:hypothetical protein
MTEPHHDGGCLCGAIRYRLTGAPSSANLCYCTQCRRQSGSPFAAFVSYPLSRFALLSGEPVTYRSSHFAVRQFCGRCGAALFWRPDHEAELDVFLGSLDDPAAMAPPDAELWTMHRLPWIPAVPGVTSYPTYRRPPPAP